MGRAFVNYECPVSGIESHGKIALVPCFNATGMGVVRLLLGRPRGATEYNSTIPLAFVILVSVQLNDTADPEGCDARQQHRHGLVQIKDMADPEGCDTLQ